MAHTHLAKKDLARRCREASLYLFLWPRLWRPRLHHVMTIATPKPDGIFGRMESAIV